MSFFSVTFRELNVIPVHLSCKWCLEADIGATLPFSDIRHGARPCCGAREEQLEIRSVWECPQEALKAPQILLQGRVLGAPLPPSL